jgi:GTPase SAR1 family protein
MPHPKSAVMTAIVGQHGVGKTSLLQAYAMPGRGGERHTSPTIGAAIINQTFAVPGENVPGRHTIWDTAGQERFQSLVPMYTRNCDILIIALPATEEPRQEAVRQLLTAALPPIRSPKVVKGALTKCDLVSPGVAAERRRRFHELLTESPQAQNRGFEVHTFATSAFTGDGVEACVGSCLVGVYQHKRRQQSVRDRLVVEEPADRRGGGRCGCKS